MLVSIYKWYRNKSLYLYYVGISLVLTGLLFSRGLISIGFFIFLGNWIIEADFRNKWETFKQNKGTAIVTLILFIHLIGMVNTENVLYGLSDLKIKLPLLLPAFLISVPALANSLKRDVLLLFFTVNVVVASICGFVNFEFFSDNHSIEDLFKLSILGQNIQVSLFACFAVCILFSKLLFEKPALSITKKVLLLISIAWLVIYVYLLNSYTGYIVLSVLLIYSISKKLNELGRIYLFLFFAISAIIISITTWYLYRVIDKFEQTEKIDIKNLPAKTMQGNLYQHDTISNRTENGHFVDLFICNKELKEGWEKRSVLPFDGRDKRGQDLSETIIRYLSSKGLKKDQSGISGLSKSDVIYIENGCANYLYINKYNLESRIYNVYWQIKTYERTGNSTAQSISQRIEFLKASKILIRNNFWFGVGSGDVMESSKNELGKMNIKLDPNYYNRVHNQYIVEFVALGLVGFVSFLIIIFYPVFRYRIWKNYLFTAFYIIILLSFFTDNPLETQLGVSFYAIFYSILFSHFVHKIQNGKLKQ